MEYLKKASVRPQEEAAERGRSVAEIIQAIRARGDSALVEYNTRFDGNSRAALRVTREEGRGGRKVVFTVEDNGTGIREEERRAVWDKGVSGRNSSGLGLAFVSGVVENMEGEIRVSSVPGEGTSISLVIPEGGKKQ